MSTLKSTRTTPRCLASLDKPGQVDLEIPRGDGRVIPAKLDHQAALALGERLVIQAKLAQLFENGQKARG
jgi:hypothetical protein